MGRWFWLLLLLTLVASAVGGWLWWRKEQIYRNETFASRVRYSLATAQASYLGMQRSRGGATEPWADVAGLCQFGVVERSLAEADDRPIQPLVLHPIPVRPVPTISPSDDEIRQFWTNDCGG